MVFACGTYEKNSRQRYGSAPTVSFLLVHHQAPSPPDLLPVARRLATVPATGRRNYLSNPISRHCARYARVQISFTV